MKALLHYLNKLTDFVGLICIISLLLMIATVFINVVVRYILIDLLVYIDAFSWYNQYLSWLGGVGMQELEWHWFSVIFLLGLGYTLREDGHVRVDIFYDKFSRRTQAWINLIGSLLLALPFCALTLYYASHFFWESFISQENIGDPGSLPRLWPIKLIIPIAFAFLILSIFAVILRELIIITGDKKGAAQ